MEFSQQICSLNLAKRLRELGVKQESVFWWCDPSDGEKADVGFIRDNHVGYKVYYSAFTVAELGEMLGSRINSITYYSNLKKYCWEKETKPVYVNSDTEADARAKMLVYLLENHII